MAFHDIEPREKDVARDQKADVHEVFSQLVISKNSLLFDGGAPQAPLEGRVVAMAVLGSACALDLDAQALLHLSELGDDILDLAHGNEDASANYESVLPLLLVGRNAERSYRLLGALGGAHLRTKKNEESAETKRKKGV